MGVAKSVPLLSAAEIFHTSLSVDILRVHVLGSLCCNRRVKRDNAAPSNATTGEEAGSSSYAFREAQMMSCVFGGPSSLVHRTFVDMSCVSTSEV